MISSGTRVRIKSKNKEGTVIGLKEGFANIIVDESGQPEWFQKENIEELDQLIDRFLKNDLDEPLDFILSMDAYRLLTEYRFNPFVLASSTKITIYPHQIDEVFKMLDNPRMMLADEVGLGKTISAALVASELRARGLINRMLFAVPKSLVIKWRDELLDRFELDAQIIDSEYVRASGNPFIRPEFCYVTSLDYLKQRHVLNMIEQKLDFALVDEAHKLSIGTERLEMGKFLSAKSDFLLLLTATPHNGNDDDFLSRIVLLDPYVSDIQSSNYLLLRNLKEEVIDLEGKEVFPLRESKTVEIPQSEKVLHVRSLLDDYLEELNSKAKNRAEQSAVRFLSTVFRKRASSSLHSLRLSMGRRLEKLGSEVDMGAVVKSVRDMEDENEGDYEGSEETFVGYTPHKTAAEVDSIKEIIEAIDVAGGDSKVEELIKWIKKIKEGDKGAKIVLFTEYRDTLSYLIKHLSGLVKVGSIDGSMDVNERKDALDSFRSPDGPEVLVCTDAAGEGIDMQFCNIEINYDIPWNPNRLEQRMGRIHRIGQKRNVFYYNFVLDPKNSIDGYILAQMLRKLENIKSALKDRVYDILGRMIRQEDIEDMYEELLKAPKGEWNARIKKLDGLIEEKRQMLAKIDGMLSGQRLDRTKLVEMKKVVRDAVDKYEVKRFVEVFIGKNEGKVQPVNEADEVYKLFLPKNLPTDVKKVIEGSFNGEVAISKSYPYLALGNKAVMAMVKSAIHPRTGLLKHPILQGLLFIYRLTIKDGEGHDRDGRLLAALYDDGKIRQVDARSIWDFEPVYDEQSQKVSTKTVMDVKESLDQGIIATTVADLLQSVKERLISIQKNAKEIVVNHTSVKIAEIESKIGEYKGRLAEGPHFQALIKKGQNDQEKLKTDMRGRLTDLESKYKAFPVVEFVGLAEVVGMPGSDVKKRVELAGMQKVIEYEKQRAQNNEQRGWIKDVSDRLTGYDIESFDRVIEVKSFSTTGRVVITSHEWSTASRIGEDYWLYVVEDALGEGKIFPFGNPAEIFKDIIVKEAVVDYQYVISNWKEKVP
jgi:superfamily II DNA or RNA helicase